MNITVSSFECSRNGLVIRGTEYWSQVKRLTMRIFAKPNKNDEEE